jgi:cell division protein CrgA
MTARPADDPSDPAANPAGDAAAGNPAAGDEAPAPPPPSPVWYGFVLTFALGLSIVWLLSYALLDLDWQQRMGAWNYLIVLGISTVFSQMLQRWHGHPRR